MSNNTNPKNVLQAFPLYFTLQNKLEDYLRTPSAMLELTDMEKDQVVETCKHMDDMALELMYAVIRFHHLYQDQGHLMEIPYQMKKNKQFHYRIEVNDLPSALQRMLYLYVQMHMQASASL